MLFVEMKSLLNEAYIIKQVRNDWAHSQTIEETTLLKFLLCCEEIVAAICTEASLYCYHQIKALRQCWCLFMAEKTLQEFTGLSQDGSIFLQYPHLAPLSE